VQADAISDNHEETVEDFVRRLKAWADGNDMHNHKCTSLLAGYDLVPEKGFEPRIFFLCSRFYETVSATFQKDKYWTATGGVFAYQFSIG
ncbi:hypothetical protein MKW98_014379, partial [Papaver atlanticum]